MLGAQLRRYRQARGLSQEDLAGLTGLTARGIRAIESGHVGRPRPATLRLLIQALNLDDNQRTRLLAPARFEAGDVVPQRSSPASLRVTSLPKPRDPRCHMTTHDPAILSDPVSRSQLVALFKALADPTRLKILGIILASPQTETCVDQLKPHFAMSQPAISQHLKVLLKAGLVTCDKRGSWHWYRLDPRTVQLLRAHASVFLNTTAQFT